MPTRIGGNVPSFASPDSIGLPSAASVNPGTFSTRRSPSPRLAAINATRICRSRFAQRSLRVGEGTRRVGGKLAFRAGGDAGDADLVTAHIEQRGVRARRVCSLQPGEARAEQARAGLPAEPHELRGTHDNRILAGGEDSN